MESCDKTIGDRLAELMRKRNMNQRELSEKLNVSRGYVDKWIHNNRPIPSDILAKICKLFDVDADYMLFGVPVRNKTVADDLGLSSNAIDYLRLLASNKDGWAVPVGWSDGWTKEEETLVTSPFFVDGSANVTMLEAVYPDEIQETVNILLGSVLGTQLLALVYKYIRTDFSSGVVRVPDNDYKEIVSVCSEAEFKSTRDDRKTIIPFSVLRYALGQAILSVLDDIRKDV